MDSTIVLCLRDWYRFTATQPIPPLLLKSICMRPLSYAASNNEAKLTFYHCTELIKITFSMSLNVLSTCVEKKTGTNYEISFSYQKPSTDTIAVDIDNNPIIDDKEGYFLDQQVMGRY